MGVAKTILGGLVLALVIILLAILVGAFGGVVGFGIAFVYDALFGIPFDPIVGALIGTIVIFTALR